MMDIKQKLEIYEAIYKDMALLEQVVDDDEESFAEDIRSKGFDFSQEQCADLFNEFKIQYVNLIKLIDAALEDDEVYRDIFSTGRKEAYEEALKISQNYTYEEFALFMELQAKQIYDAAKTNSGCVVLSMSELDEVTGGDEWSSILKELGRWLKGLACFSKNAKVMMADGSEKNIVDVKLDDEVLSVNKAGETISAKVIYVKKPSDSEIYKVTFANGSTWECTSSQWLYSGDDIYPVIEAVGKKALCPDGTKTEIIDVQPTGRCEKVYDLTVDGDNNYLFVNGVAAEGYGS